MTTALQRERAFLAQADRHIADGDRRIGEQEARIARLRAEGLDCTEAEKSLRLCKETMNEHCAHRRLILERIAYLEI